MNQAVWMHRRAVLSELCSLGVSQKRASALLRKHPPAISNLCKRVGVRLPREGGGWEPHKARSRSRAEVMAALYRTGKTLQEIGTAYGISRERVRQLMTKHLGVTQQDGGQHKRAEQKRAAAAHRREVKAMLKHGCTVAEWRDLIRIGDEMVAAGRGRYQTPLYAFRAQRNNAARRGIGWELTAWQWWTIWQQSGHWEHRGRGQGYVMCRNGDTGPYAVGNVFIATAAENSSEGQRYHRIDPTLPIGVTRTGSGLYTVMRRRRHLGLYETVEQAQSAYLLDKRVDGDQSRGPRARGNRNGLPSGISRSPRSGTNPFRAYFYEGSRQFHVGSFPSVEAAIAARAQALAERQAA